MTDYLAEFRRAVMVVSMGVTLAVPACKPLRDLCERDMKDVPEGNASYCQDPCFQQEFYAWGLGGKLSPAYERAIYLCGLEPRQAEEE